MFSVFFKVDRIKNIPGIRLKVICESVHVCLWSPVGGG